MCKPDANLPSRHRIRQPLAWAAVLLILFMLHDASAKEQLNCSAYAATAVAQNDQNVMQGCGFAGPRWSSELKGHLQWCETATMADLTNEDRARKDMLAQCAEKPKQDQQACQAYAKAAVEHQIANKTQGCGFAGGAWSENYASHFEWCLKASPEIRGSEGNARYQQLLGCFAAQKAAKKDACAAYAATAVEQQKENEKRGCKFSGGLWSADWFGHFKWCEGVNKATSDKELQLRLTALKEQCLKQICHWTRRCSGFPTFACTTTTKCQNVPR